MDVLANLGRDDNVVTLYRRLVLPRGSDFANSRRRLEYCIQEAFLGGCRTHRTTEEQLHLLFSCSFPSS